MFEDHEFVNVPLEKIRLHVNKVFEPFASYKYWPAMVKTQVEMMGQQLMIHIEAMVAVQPLEKRTIKAPKDWWEAVKERWAPRWWLRYHPVEYTVETLESHTLYPKIALPKESIGIVYTKTKKEH